jgi:hypothetical protein
MFSAIAIGRMTFDSKADASRFFKAMLNSYRLLDRVVEHDDEMLRALFKRHPDYAAKLRGGKISHFEVHPFVHGSRCFFLVRTDGSRTHFSFKKCI